MQCNDKVSKVKADIEADLEGLYQEVLSRESEDRAEECLLKK